MVLHCLSHSPLSYTYANVLTVTPSPSPVTLYNAACSVFTVSSHPPIPPFPNPIYYYEFICSEFTLHCFVDVCSQ